LWVLAYHFFLPATAPRPPLWMEQI
jgi:hypothetical protein